MRRNQRRRKKETDNTKKIILAHLSETNNLEELALKTVNDIIGNQIRVEAARQNEELEVTI